MKLRIAFITKELGRVEYQGKWYQLPIGGAGYYRSQLPADALNEFSDVFEAKVFGAAAQNRQTGQICPIDADGKIDESGWPIICLQRWMDRHTPDMIYAARLAGQIVINDLDDHLFALDQRNSAFQSNNAGPEWNLEHYARALRASNLVTVTNERLAQVVADMGAAVTVIPNMIDLRNWTRQQVASKVRRIGWIGMTNYRSGDLETVGNALVKVHDNHSFRFVHGGHVPKQHGRRVEDHLQLGDIRVEHRDSRPIEQYPELWQGIDLAICPLSDLPFNRIGKSPIKAMEASAAGVPYVAASLDPYVDFGEGLFAGTPDEYESQINRLIRDRQLRLDVTERAYQRVCQDNVDIRVADWHNTYLDLAVGQAQRMERLQQPATNNADKQLIIAR